MVSEKTLILLDTNKAIDLLKGSPRYDSFDFGREFVELQEFVKKNQLSDEITFAISELTLSELLSQKKRSYEKDLKSFKEVVERLRSLKGVEIPECELPDKSFDCIGELNPLVQKFLGDNKIKVLTINPKDKAEIFDVIIKKSIERSAPFRKDNGKNPTDRGFKDAVIFETLKKHPAIVENTNIILFTQDLDFQGCKEEVKKVNFNILPSTRLLIGELDSIYEKKILEIKYSSVIGKDYFLSNLIQRISSESGVNSEEINVIRLNVQIIENKSDLKKIFDFIPEDEDYFEGLVGLHSRVRIKGYKYNAFTLVDLVAKEIEIVEIDDFL